MVYTLRKHEADALGLAPTTTRELARAAYGRESQRLSVNWPVVELAADRLDTETGAFCRILLAARAALGAEDAPAAEITPVPHGHKPVAERLEEIANGAFFIEHFGGQTLVWPDDWYDVAKPLTVIAGEHSKETMELWAMGWAAGRQKGEETGHAIGFSACQAGLRALLGAGSAADVETLLKAATARS